MFYNRPKKNLKENFFESSAKVDIYLRYRKVLLDELGSKLLTTAAASKKQKPFPLPPILIRVNEAIPWLTATCSTII